MSDALPTGTVTFLFTDIEGSTDLLRSLGMDAYDTVLPKIYAEAGFEAVSRTKWDDDYAPDDWDYATYAKFNGGRPDVVAMVYNPDAVGKPYTGGGSYAEDYDAMMSAAQARVTELHG